MNRFDKKTVIVTGASVGLGKATALKMGSEGAKVIVNYYLDSDKEQVDAIVKEIETTGGNAMPYKADISIADQVKAMIDKTVEVFGSIDVLVNNAGIMEPYTPLADIDEKVFDSVINVDLKGTFLCCKYAIPYMIRQGKGVITNIASVAALSAAAGGAAYAAAKCGVIGLTRKITYDYGELGVRCNAVCPGNICTPMSEEMFKKVPGRKKFVMGVPAGRTSTPEEIAGFVAFISSDEADYIHGQSCAIDGGWTIKKKFIE